MPRRSTVMQAQTRQLKARLLHFPEGDDLQAARRRYQQPICDASSMCMFVQSLPL